MQTPFLGTIKAAISLFSLPAGIHYVTTQTHTTTKKLLFFSLLILASTQAFSQNTISHDSLHIRIHNKGKYYLREYIITIDKKDYKFKDIYENKYSNYIKVPYLWPTNQTKTTIVVKRIIKYNERITITNAPVDHISENKLTQGKYTIELSTKIKKQRLELEVNYKKEE